MTFGGNYWLATAGEHDPHPCVEGRVRTRVAILGGGLMGAAAAMRLAERGVETVLVEAETIGSGASSKPGGFVVPHFSVGSPGEVMRRVGESGKAVVDLVGNSASRLYQMIRDNGLDCEARQDGWYHPAHSRKALERIRQIQAEWEEQGQSFAFLDGKATTRATGVGGYWGSLFAPTGGTVHPLKLTRAMMAAACERGCVVYENSPVVEIRKEAGQARLLTATGEVVADLVLVCTNGRRLGLCPELEGGIIALPVWQCATEPLDASATAHLFANGECLSDTRRNLFTYRFTRDRRLITGTFDAAFASETSIAASLSRRLHEELRLPFAPRIEYLWKGTSSISAARLPVTIVRDGPVIAASACNARGIALSVSVGRELADSACADTVPSIGSSGSALPSRTGKLQRAAAPFYPYFAGLLDRIAG